MNNNKETKNKFTSNTSRLLKSVRKKYCSKHKERDNSIKKVKTYSNLSKKKLYHSSSNKRSTAVNMNSANPKNETFKENTTELKPRNNTNVSY